MNITARHAQDIDELRRLTRGEGDAKQRDRYRAALLAIEGLETEAILKALGRSRGFVQRWAYVYRDHGISAIAPKRQPGARPRLAADKVALFKARFEAGPARADGGVCTLRGKDAARILEREFGVRYSLSGAYDLLHRLGYSCLKPRPRHRKSDPAAMEQWKAGAPLLSRR